MEVSATPPRIGNEAWVSPFRPTVRRRVPNAPGGIVDADPQVSVGHLLLELRDRLDAQSLVRIGIGCRATRVALLEGNDRDLAAFIRPGQSKEKLRDGSDGRDRGTLLDLALGTSIVLLSSSTVSLPSSAVASSIGWSHPSGLLGVVRELAVEGLGQQWRRGRSR